MKNKRLFNAFSEMYERFSTASALPDYLSELGCRVDLGGRGDSSYALTVVCLFKDACGDDWDAFKEYYAPTKEHPESFFNHVTAKLRWFWPKVDDVRFELVRLASVFYRNNR